MKIIKLETSSLLEFFKPHKELKPKLLKLLEHTKIDNEVLGGNFKPLSKKYSNDKIKTDWSQSEDFSRPWTQVLYPFLKNHFNNDGFILYHRQLAYEQIKKALNKDNNFYNFLSSFLYKKH